MAKFQFKELVIGGSDADITARVAAGTTSSNAYSDKEVGKFVKLAAESRYALCAAGDPIEGHIVAMEPHSSDDYSMGTVRRRHRKEVTFDGLEATAGTGTVALGDYVVCGTVVAAGTALSAPAKVCKATNQPTVALAALDDNVKTTIDAALVLLVDKIANALNGWRVISLGSAGTGAVGTTGIIERVGS